MARRQAMLAALAQASEQEILKVGIFSPDLGQREDLPSILLPEAFTQENVNILQQDGKLSRMKMRLPDFLEAEFSTGTITATNGSDTITSSEGVGAWGSAATHKPCWGSDQVSGDGRTITITDVEGNVEYTIKDVADDGATLTLTENYAGTGGGGLSYSIGTAGQKVQSPDGNKVLRYHRLIKIVSGVEVEYVYAFTKAHIYLWSSSYSAFILKFTCASDCSYWDVESYDQQVIATNFVDKVQVHGSTISAAFGNLTGDANGIDIGGGTYITKAQFVWEYENYVKLAYVELDGTVSPELIVWCTKDDETDFDQTGSGDADMLELKGGGFITGHGKYEGLEIIGKASGMKFGQLVTTAEVFAYDDIEGLGNVGCRAGHSMINDKTGRLYWLASDYTYRRLPGGEVVSGPKDATFKQINPAYEKYIDSTFINEYGLIFLSVPIGGGATGNNMILQYHPEQDTWGEIDIATPAFGKYARQTVLDWATLPEDDWASWGWKNWAGPENTIGYLLDICSDDDGYTYDLHLAEKDNTEDYDGYFVLSTDLIQKMVAKRYNIALNQFKTLLYMQVWAGHEENEEYSLEIYIKRDIEKNWQSVDSIGLCDSKEREIFPTEIREDKCDFRARNLLIKISMSNPAIFYGIVLGFVPDGFEE